MNVDDFQDHPRVLQVNQSGKVSSPVFMQETSTVSIETTAELCNESHVSERYP
jgi:hypothetical protein